MTARYAAGTEVSVDRSIAELRKLLTRYSATAFFFAEQDGRSIVGFVMDGRQVRFELPMPDFYEQRFWRTPTGRNRSDSAAQAEYQGAIRQVWRIFTLVVKAKLEAVASGLTEFQTEFLAHIVLPGGQTVEDAVSDKVNDAYASGQVPALLPDYRRAIER